MLLLLLLLPEPPGELLDVLWEVTVAGAERGWGG